MRSWKFWLLAALPSTLLIAAVISMVLLKRHQDALRTEIVNRLAAITAAGEPVTTQDLARLYPDPPKNLDIVILLNRSLALIHLVDNQPMPIGADDLPAPISPLAPETRAKLEQIVQSNNAALAELPAQLPNDVRAPNNFSQGFTNSFSLTHFSWLMELLIQDSLLHIENNESEAAVFDIVTCLRMSHSLQNTLLMHSLNTYGERMCSGAIERLLALQQLNEQQLIKLSRALPAIDSIRQQTKNIIYVSRCLEIWNFQSFQSALAQMGKQRLLWTSFRETFDISPFPRVDMINYLDLIDRLLGIVHLSPRARLKECLELRKLGKSSPFPWLRWEEIFELDDITETRLRLTRIALMIERHRLKKHGETPSSLDDLLPDLSPESLQDPFGESSAMFKYQKLPVGYLIYSVGKDGKDQHGTLSTEKTSSDDLVFWVPR